MKGAAWLAVAAYMSAVSALNADDTSFKVNTPHDLNRPIIFNHDLVNWRLFVGGKKLSEVASPDDLERAFRISVRYGKVPGVSAQSLSVGYSSFPFWRSDLYSPLDHERFIRTLAYYRGVSDQNDGWRSPLLRALLNSMDLIEIFRGELRSPIGVAQSSILNFRVNDAHYTHYYDLFKNRSRQEILQSIFRNRSPFCESRSGSALALVDAWAQTSFTGYFEAFQTGKMPDSLGDRCQGDRCLSAQGLNEDCRGGTCVMRFESAGCPTVVLNFESESVRRFKLMQLHELAARYRPSALELDLDRFPAYFHERTPPARREEIMQAWLSEASSTIRAAAPGTQIGLRVPNRVNHRRAIGVSLQRVSALKLADYAILAMPFFADQQPELDVEPGAGFGLYAEMTHSTGRANVDPGLLTAAGLTPVTARYRDAPATSRQLITAANQAYRLGMDGMALFNMAYYLEIGSGVPPLDLPRSAIACMARPSCAARSDQEYALAYAHYRLQPASNMLPIRLSKSMPRRTFSLRISPPEKGWSGDGILSVSAVPEGPNSAARLAEGIKVNLSLNGVPLVAIKASWPADTLDGPANQEHVKRLWFNQAPFRSLYLLDRRILRDGINEFSLENSEQGQPQTVRVVDFRVFLPAQQQ